MEYIDRYIYETESYERLRYELSIFLKEFNYYKAKLKKILFNPIYDNTVKLNVLKSLMEKYQMIKSFFWVYQVLVSIPLPR